MMNYLCSRLLLVIAILMSFAVHAHAEDAFPVQPDRQYEYAQYLFDQGRFTLAAAEFQRFAFFFPNDPRQRSALFNSGLSLFRAGELKDAIAQFKSLTHNPVMDTPATESFFKLAESYVQINEPGQALLSLHNLLALSQDEKVGDRAYYSMAWIRIDGLDWAGAQQALEKMTDAGHSLFQTAELIKSLNEVDTLPRKSPGLAGTLSIIPGAGQLYCGRYEDALTAFVVDVGLFWASYESFDNDLNVLGTLLAIVGIGFYGSNIYSAVSSAHKYNDSRKHRFAGQLKHNMEIRLSPVVQPLSNGMLFKLNITF